MKKHQKEDIMNIKEKLASASKKERTPQQQKAMTILNWVATAVCIVVIVFALVVAIFTIAGTTNDDHLMRFGDKIYLNVASDSMEPTFSTSDVIIANAFNYEKQLAELKVGQVVTFKTTVRSGGNTYEVFNTHRIVRINFEENGTTVRNLPRAVTIQNPQTRIIPNFHGKTPLLKTRSVSLKQWLRPTSLPLGVAWTPTAISRQARCSRA